MRAFLLTAVIVATSNTLISYSLTFARLLGPVGRRATDALVRAPLLDGVIGVLTWVPWLTALLLVGWRGLVGAVVGEFIAFHLWVLGHELMNREAARGPRIVKSVNRIVGRWQNHLALWITTIALPGFLAIRLSQVLVYPWLIKLLRFPRYNTGDWINCSRQHFEGLVGHDLIWCLYCDWMTGLYSLGGEMLRNLESFWCPIRFYDGKKCDNCNLDFPDIANGWVAADATMAEVAAKVETMYAKTSGIDNAWFGHPVRMTVKGKSV